MNLIGREEELRRLGGLLEGISLGGGAVLLRGEAGIGKSALLAELAERASDMGLRVLATVSVESEAHLQFAGLHQLLRSVRRDIDLLPQHQRDALRAALGLGLGEGTFPNGFLVALAALDLLSEIAMREPLLVIAEDAQWLDRSSAHVIAFLGRRLASEPIVLVAAVREGVPSRLDDAGLPELVVPPLSRAHAETLMDAHATGLSDDLRRRLLADAAGKPLALIELPVAAQETDRRTAVNAPWLPLTERLERAFTARVAALPEPTATALLIAALDNGSSMAEIIRATQVLSGRETCRVDLAPAVAARLIEVDGDSVRFRHPLMRSAIHQLATAERRRAAHSALADVLADVPARSVWHRAAATDPPNEEVAGELETAAQELLRRGSVSGAVTSLEHAAHLSGAPDLRADRLLRAAELAVELGRRDVVDRLLASACRLDLSPRQRARLAWTRASFDDGVRDGTTGALTLVRLAESMVADGHVDMAMRILWSAALRCFWTEPGAEARDRIVAVAERLPIDELDPRMLATLAYAAPIERGAVVIERSLRLVARSILDSQAERLLGTTAATLGAFDLAQGRSAASISGLRAEGRLQLLARALAVQAWSAAHLVDLTVAIPAAEEAGELARETGQPYLHAVVQATRAKIAALRGDVESAEALAAAAVRTGISVGSRPILGTAQNARALAALATGEFAEAFTRFARMHDVADPSYQVAMRCYTVGELVDAAVRSGEQGAAARIVADLEHAATLTTSPSLHAGLRMARALLADDEQADACFAEALKSDLHAQPFIRAYTELAFGEWLRRQRRVAESRQPLRAARDAFDALGAVPWGERARRELRAAGEQSGSRQASVLDQLTAQELQIAQLAATGLTNREIAQRLYVSHRTVGAHLSQVYPKLQITSRAQLHGIPGLMA